jgi:SAM-dependent methyltransferase
MAPFMKLADIGLFARSAASDARIRSAWTNSGAANVFDSVYASAPDNDPWASASPAFLYQRRKYETIAALIPAKRYRRALDLGCGTGLFSERLAAIADDVVGVDVSSVAVGIAISRAKGMPNLHFTRGDVLELPSSWDGSFDLITILDTLYYLPPPIEDGLLKTLATRLSRLLSPKGLLLLANHYFAGLDADSRLTRRIHDAFRWSPALHPVGAHRRPFYLVSLLRGHGSAAAPRALDAVPA